MTTKFAAFDRLALRGGSPVRTTSLPPWPVFDDEMTDAVTRVLKTGKVNYWTGQECREFEKEFAQYVGTKHAIALANGTLALELALMAYDIGPGDEVIVPPRTFLATASAVVMRGATPIFADLDPHSGNLNAETIAAAITPRTKAVIVVHLAGWPCDMAPIMELARQHGIKVIEDCAQAHGAMYRGQMVGSIGDIGAFSFCQDKIMTTAGEGGMLTLNDSAIWDKCWSFKDHGKSWDAVYNRPHTGIFKWLHESFGTNWRLTEIQAVIGRIATKRLPEWVAARRRNAAQLTEQLVGTPGIELLDVPSDCEHAYYKYYLHVTPEALQGGWTRDEIVRALQAEGISCGSGACCEIYREKAFAKAGLEPKKDLPNAAHLAQIGIMFMVHPTLDADAISDTALALKKVMRACCHETATHAKAA